METFQTIINRSPPYEITNGWYKIAHSYYIETIYADHQFMYY